jgi:hypothetical protein
MVLYSKWVFDFLIPMAINFDTHLEFGADSNTHPSWYNTHVNSLDSASWLIKGQNWFYDF